MAYRRTAARSGKEINPNSFLIDKRREIPINCGKSNKANKIRAALYAQTGTDVCRDGCNAKVNREIGSTIYDALEYLLYNKDSIYYKKFYKGIRNPEDVVKEGLAICNMIESNAYESEFVTEQDIYKFM